MNTAVLLLTACVAGQAPTAMPPAAPAPVYAPAYGPGYGGGYGGAYAGSSACYGHASVDCCGGGHECCLLHKIHEKLRCIHFHCPITLSLHCPVTCDKPACGPVCPKPCPAPCPPKPCCPPKPVCNPCPPKPVCYTPAPVCNPCPKPVCCPQPAPCPPTHCPKPACCTVQPTCHSCSTSVCWTPGYCLHKCKEKLCGLCDFGGSHGGCGTACTPCAGSSSVVVPQAGPAYAPAPVAPAAPAAPKAMPDVKKVGSAYGPVQPEVRTVGGTTPRVIDLTPSPF